MEPRPIAAVLAGWATVIAVALFVWQAESSYNGVPLLHYRTVYASLPNIGHLQRHDPVDIAGVRVGQVLDTGVRRGRALVRLQLRGVGPLPSDSQVVVRANGLLGARYVELKPGRSPRMLPDGGTLSGGTASFTSGIPETLNLFDARTRTAMEHMTDGLGTGLLGRGQQLGDALRVGPASGANFDHGVDAVLARPGAAAAFLPAVAAGVHALSTARDDIAGTFGPAARTAQPFAAERRAVGDALAMGPSTEAAVGQGLGRPGRRLLGSVRRLSGASTTLLATAPAAFGSATRLLRESPRPLIRTRLVLDRVPHAVPATLGILAGLRPDIAPLRQAFTSLVDPVTELSLHGCDIQMWASALHSLVSWGSMPGGHFGPNVGFPLTVMLGSQQADNVIADGLPRFPTSDYYPKPCEYAPGAVIPGKSLMDVAEGVLP